MDKDTPQPEQSYQPQSPLPQPQLEPVATPAPATPFQQPTAAPVQPENAQVVAPPVIEQAPFPQQVPVSQPVTETPPVEQQPPQANAYTINAQLTPVEVEGADDLISAMHRHEKTSSLAVIIVVVLFSVLWLGLAYYVHSARMSSKAAYEKSVKESSTEFKAEKAEIGFGAEVVDRPDGTLDLSRPVENLYLAKDQDVMAKVGQQVNFYNGTSFIVTGIQDNWKPSDKRALYQPKDGYKLVKLELAVGNRSKNAGSVTFEYFSTKAKQEMRVNSKSFLPAGTFPEEYADFSISSGSLNNGQSIKAGIVLEVSEAAKDIIIVDGGGAFDKDGNYTTTTMKARYTL